MDETVILGQDQVESGWIVEASSLWRILLVVHRWSVQLSWGEYGDSFLISGCGQPKG